MPPRPNEFQLIHLLTRGLRGQKGVVVGIGDDAAVLRPNAREDLVVTTDAQVENRHFVRAWFTGRDVGARLAAVNLSDIAAMGAQPRFALISMAVPRDVNARWLGEVERGAAAELARHGAVIVGGNLTSTEGPLVLDLTLVGACARGRAWRRMARPGDAIVVAGELGAAAAGLALLRDGVARGPLVRAYRRPVARVAVARALARSRSVHGAIDVSDGLSSDLIHLCVAARVGCELDASALPVSRAVRAYCSTRGIHPVTHAMNGGDDYALVLAVAPQRAAEVCRTIRRAGCPAAVVGRFTRKRGHRLLLPDGTTRRFGPGGWNHFHG